MILGFWLWLALGAQQSAWRLGCIEPVLSRFVYCFVPFVAFFAVFDADWAEYGGFRVFRLILLTTSTHAFEIGRVGGFCFGSLLWAVHGAIGRSHQSRAVLPFIFVQMATCAVLSGVSSWLLREPWRWAALIRCVGICFMRDCSLGWWRIPLQIYGQRYESAGGCDYFES